MAPWSWAVRATSEVSRVLPMPGSPVIRTVRRPPAATSFHAVVTASASPSRPTKEKASTRSSCTGSATVSSLELSAEPDSGSQRTSAASTGSGSPFSSSSPTDTSS